MKILVQYDEDTRTVRSINQVYQSIKFISRSTCTKMNKKYIFHKLTGKRWKLKLTTYKHFSFLFFLFFFLSINQVYFQINMYKNEQKVHISQIDRKKVEVEVNNL